MDGNIHLLSLLLLLLLLFLSFLSRGVILDISYIYHSLSTPSLHLTLVSDDSVSVLMDSAVL